MKKSRGAKELPSLDAQRAADQTTLSPAAPPQWRGRFLPGGDPAGPPPSKTRFGQPWLKGSGPNLPPQEHTAAPSEAHTWRELMRQRA